MRRLSVYVDWEDAGRLPEDVERMEKVLEENEGGLRRILESIGCGSRERMPPTAYFCDSRDDGFGIAIAGDGNCRAILDFMEEYRTGRMEGRKVAEFDRDRGLIIFSVSGGKIDSTEKTALHEAAHGMMPDALYGTIGVPEGGQRPGTYGSLACGLKRLATGAIPKILTDAEMDIPEFYAEAAADLLRPDEPPTGRELEALLAGKLESVGAACARIRGAKGPYFCSLEEFQEKMDANNILWQEYAYVIRHIPMFAEKSLAREHGGIDGFRRERPEAWQAGGGHGPLMDEILGAPLPESVAEAAERYLRAEP